ncbi:MAG: hypothetical protein WDN46_07610 [Methylocella sp.]
MSYDAIYSATLSEVTRLRETIAAKDAELALMREALETYEDALSEAEAIFGGEYADHYGPMFELAMKARDARAALQASKPANEKGQA